jgi:hypothetical protein
MGKKTVAQQPSKSRRVIEILVLLVIIAGIILVVAELTINVLPEVKGKPSVSQENQGQVKTALDKSLTGPAPTTPSKTNATK